MKILFIAPIPPPTDGQSKASKVLLDRLINNNYEVIIANTQKKTLKSGITSLTRIFEILKILLFVFKNRKNNDIIYLSLAESFWGNIRDLMVYTICFKFRKRLFIHMLGGAGMKEILSSNGIQKRINKFFISRIAGVIVEGPLNFEVFKQVTNSEKIHIVPNFAEDFLFVNDNELASKYLDISNIQILYLSNLIPGKGYDELVESYFSLQEEVKNQIEITFVGGFESDNSKKLFLDKIKNEARLKYIGSFIDGEAKRKLYCQMHVFCLPTYYPFEGQPISILEAYSTGCVVITSNHSGIPYIFSDNKNGFLVEKKSVLSIKKAIEKTVFQKENLIKIAQHNRDEALLKYRTEHFQNKILNIFYNNNKSK